MLRRLLTLAGYIGAGLFIIGATIVLVAYGKGYSYDFTNHRFVLNGLVILESTPDNADIKIAGKEIRPDTPYRTTIEAGDYDFEVSKGGFRTWKKRLSVLPSEVTFARYILLVPNQIKTEKVKLNLPAAGAIASPNRKRIAYLTSGKGAGVWVLDVGSRKTKRVYTPRPAAGNAPAETLGSVSWSDDDSRLLVISKLADTHYLIINANGGGEAQDLTDLFNQNFSQLKFDPADNNQMYWISPQSNLHRLNLSDRTASAVIAPNVVAFAFGGGRVYYVQATSLGRSLFAIDRAGRKQELIQSLAQSSSYEVLFSRYDDRDHLVVIPSQTKTATLYQNIFDAHPTSKVIAHDVTKLTRSPSSRFIAAYDGKNVVVYDLEKNRRYDFKADFKSIQSQLWFDDFHLLVTHEGIPTLVEYDGGNSTDLPGGLQGQVFATPDHVNVIGFSTDASTQVIYERVK